MLPPEEYEEASRNADWHVQISIEDVKVKSDEAVISGPILKVFRGTPELQGRRLSLQVNCLSADEKDDFAPDGFGYFTVNSLQIGSVLEAYVNNTPSGLEIPLGLCTLLISSTLTPQLQ